jgi:hypothetical protein
MDGAARSRKWVPALCALALSGCGDEAEKPAAAKATPAADNPLAQRCSRKPATGDGGFPDGLLPAGSVVVGDGYAIAPGKLSDVYRQLRAGAGGAGLTVRDSEIETLDAELELEGPDGELGLRLGIARECPRATDVHLTG